MEKYHTKNRHKYLINLHIIFVVKYRKSLIKNYIDEDIKQWCYDICSKSDIIINIMETDKDHIHLLIDIPPTITPSNFVRKLKQQTSWNLWLKYPQLLRKHFWKEKTFWSDGYFVCSTGDVSTKTIQEYIRNQG